MLQAHHRDGGRGAHAGRRPMPRHTDRSLGTFRGDSARLGGTDREQISILRYLMQMIQIAEEDEKSDSIPALIDSHCHLNYKPLADEIDLIIERAKKAGVGAALTIGTTLSEFPQVAALAERSENLWCTVGVHPHEASREPVTAGPLQQTAH